MDTIITPCRVPWMISPSGSGVTLSHSESDTEPECKVTFCAGRLRWDDVRVGPSAHVEIVFDSCHRARLGPHGDREGVEVLGYTVDPPAPRGGDYPDWLARRWREAGICPRSGFWVAERSAWINALPDFFRRDFRHYVVDGRDGYVELIARRFTWRAWATAEGEHESDHTRWPVVDQGEGAA